MSKFQRLPKIEYPVSDKPIIPRPDIEVEVIANNTAIVRSGKHLGEWRVIELVQAKQKGNWIFPIEWRNTIDEQETVQANPHRNNDGFWVWLLKRV